MRMARQELLFATTFGVLVLGGCAQTSYRPFAAEGDTPVPFAREIRFERTDAMFRDPPDCVTVLPAEGDVSRELASMAEASVARQLTGKVARVIGPQERLERVRKLAVDLGTESDRRYFARTERCRFVVKIAVVELGNVYLLVWSERRIGLSLELVRVEEGETLWRAHHTARRGDGGLPLSPVSVAMSAFEAGSFQADDDVLPSLLDDVLRRMFVTLPDFR